MNATHTFQNWSGRQRDPHDITWEASRNYSHTPIPLKPPGKRASVSIRGLARRKFEGAANTDFTADWTVGQVNNDADLHAALPKLRERAKDLSQNNPYGVNFLRLLRKNVVGPQGIQLQMELRLSKPGKPLDDTVNTAIEDAWKDFNKPANFTVTRKTPGIFAQFLMIEAAARNGEILLRKVRGYQNKHKFAVQFLDPEQLDHNLSKNLPGGGFIRMGVEFDLWGAPVRYHFLSRNPADSSHTGAAGSVSRGRAWTLPASEIIHAFIPNFENQSRGYTWFHAAIIMLRHLGKYREAAIIEARAGAEKMGFYKPEKDANGEFVGDAINEEGEFVDESSPGSWSIIPKGYSIEQYDPKNPNGQHADFAKSMLKGVASALGVNYPDLTADLEGVNYSSIRQGVLSDRDGYKMLQRFLIDFVLEDIFADWLKIQLVNRDTLLGSLPFVPRPNAFERWNHPKFEGRQWPWVDPLKDVNAEKTAVEAGFKSKQRVQKGMGISDPDAENAQIAKEREAAPPPANPPA